MVLPAHTKPRFPAPFLQTLPELVTPLKGHSLSPRSCPPTVSALPKVLLLLLFDLGVGGPFVFVVGGGGFVFCFLLLLQLLSFLVLHCPLQETRVALPG